MKRRAPNKLNRTAQSAIMSPLTAGLVALRLGRADSEHYHDLAGAMSIGYRAAELVPRHRPLLAAMQPALDALNAIFERAKQRTVADAHWSGTVAEVDEIENGIRIYEGIVRTTPGPVMLRAIARVQRDAVEAMQAD